VSRIRYSLSFPRPSNHLIDVLLEIDEVHAAFVDLVMPAWIPGSYKIRDFARHVQEFRAPRFRKVDKSTWRVETGGRSRLRVRYRVYAFEMAVRTSHLDADHAHLNPSSVCMYVEGRRDEPCEVRLAIPRGWRVATGLSRRGGAWAAESYDHLADSPIELGRFQRRTFRVRGKPHEFAICGPGNHDIDAIVRDTARIVEAGARLFGGLPYDRYVFILHSTEGGGGGLEHRNSTSLMFPRMDFKPRENYRRCLNLIAHEFFHTWNVKRILPEAFRPYDYTREVYTDLLWAMEGLTDYYALLLVGRARLLTAAEVRETLGQWLEEYRQKPSRRVQSLSESSFDTWIKLYQPNEQSVNSTMSYYEKGKIVGLLLDMEIRRRSRGRRSLDDVMRGLYREFAERGRGIDRSDLVRLAEEAAGGELGAFFRDFVDGTRELPLDRALRTVGLRVKSGSGKNRPKATLGVTTNKHSDRIVVNSVLAGSPAEAAGLSAHDEIVAVDGLRATTECWNRVVETSRPGQSLRLDLFRGGILKSLSVRLGTPPRFPSAVERAPMASAERKRNHRSWIGLDWKA
jgi:predicted metalloprotease with PDZ domain